MEALSAALTAHAARATTLTAAFGAQADALGALSGALDALAKLQVCIV